MPKPRSLTVTKRYAYFRVYPRPGTRWYYLVRIFTSHRAAVRFHQSVDWCGPFGHHTRGCCHSFKVYSKRHRITRQLGEIHLRKGWLGMSVITHESVHAGIGFLDRIGVQLTTKPFTRARFTGPRMAPKRMPYSGAEEQLCRAVHETGRQIVEAVYALGWEGK